MVRRFLVFATCFFLVLAAVYLGVNTVERGITDIMGLNIPPRAFCWEVQEEEITLYWAGIPHSFDREIFLSLFKRW